MNFKRIFPLILALLLVLGALTACGGKADGDLAARRRPTQDLRAGCRRRTANRRPAPPLPQSHLQLRLCAGRCLRKRNRRPVRRRVRGRPRHFAGILNHTQAADENRRLKLSKKPFRLFRQKNGRPACMVCTNVGILIPKLCRNPHLIWC